MLARVSSTPTFKRLPRAVREQQMLDAAVKVFSRRGFHAASMDEIAEDAGISKPMVYAYLGTKEELFVACLHREGTRLIEAIAGAAAPRPARRRAALARAARVLRLRRRAPGRLGGALPAGPRRAAVRRRTGRHARAGWSRWWPGCSTTRCAPKGARSAPTDLEVVAYALVGADRVAGRLARRPPGGRPGEDRDPDDERRLARRRPTPAREPPGTHRSD